MTRKRITLITMILLLLVITAGRSIKAQASETEKNVNAKEVISYVYVDETEVKLPGKQSVVVGFLDEQFLPETVILKYHSVVSGKDYEWQASDIVEGAALFEQKYGARLISDQFVLDDISYTAEGKTYTVRISDLDMGELTYFVGDGPESEIQASSWTEGGVEATVYQSGDTQESAASVVPSGRNVVIVLCAGHDITHSGAFANGLNEAILNFKVMNYCREELEQYQGVTVYTDRPTVECKYPGQSTDYCLYQRIEDAAALGANTFIDFHFNAGGFSGSEVYYPNISYNKTIHREGGILAEKIIRQLEQLGLPNRGARIRDCTTNDRDKEGNLEDYYATINESKRLGMTGIIIEHAYLDNYADASKLHSEEFLKQIGIADARGIADTYNLSKKGGENNFHFVDISPEEWYYDSIKSVYENEIMTGLNATTFGPLDILCRAQFATIIYRLEGKPKTNYEERFLDVSDKQFFTKAVLWAASSDVNVLTGYGNGYFGALDDITREQLVTILYRYAQYLELDVSARADLQEFPDKNSVTGFAAEAMRWAVAEKLIRGDNGKLNPLGSTTRAECATIIMRFAKMIAEEETQDPEEQESGNHGSEKPEIEDQKSETQDPEGSEIELQTE